MTWHPMLGVLGVLFLIFGTVDWLLFRLEREERRSKRSLGFCCSGILALTLFAILARYPGLTAWATPKWGSASALTVLEQQLSPDIKLIEAMVGGKKPASLQAVREARRHLIQMRQLLSTQYPLTSSLRPLISQSDTLLGVAYQTLGSQWMLIKSGQWSDLEARKQATEQIVYELERWREIRNCIAAARVPCANRLTLDATATAVQTFSYWFHPWMVELVRFQESDPDLVDSSVAEINRVRAFLERGLSELAAKKSQPSIGPIVLASEKMLQEATHALSLENAAVHQGQWETTAMNQVFYPIHLAFEQYLRALACTTNQVEQGACH